MRSVDVSELLTAIRAHCLECSGGSRKLVEQCALKKCDLYGYRSAAAMEAGKKKEPDRMTGQLNMLDMIKERQDGKTVSGTERSA